jgi:hypothetical protein
MQGIRHPYIKTSTSRKYTKDDMAANHIIEDSEGNQYTVDQLLQTVQTGLNPNDLLTMLLGVDGPGTLLNSDMVDDHHASDFLLANLYTADDILSKLNSIGTPVPINVDKLDNYDASAFLLLSNYIEASSFNDLNGYIKFKNSLQLVWGTVSITPVANTPTKATVNFPVAFTTIPTALVSIVTGYPGNIVLGASSNNITTSSVDIYITRTDTTSTAIRYLLIGK